MLLQALPFVILFAALELLLLVTLVLSLWNVWRLGRCHAPKISLFAEFLIIALLITASLSVLSISPYAASDLKISDAVEYSVGADRILSAGSYSLFIDGKELPPRYPPWFSALVILPAYLVSGAELGNAVVPITILAVMGVLAAFSIARFLGGMWAGILAASGLLIDASYRYFSTFPMTDVPAALFILLIFGICLIIHNDEASSKRSWALLGLIISFGTAIRPTLAFVLVPVLLSGDLLVHKQRKSRRMAFILAPMLFLGAMQLAYNVVKFGSPLRSGYNFWVPFPYDFFSAVFSLSYLVSNLQELMMHTPFMIAGVMLFLMRDFLSGKASAGQLEMFDFSFFLRLGSLFAIPLCAFYLLYFYSTSRFYLPLTALCYVVLGVLLSVFLSRVRGIERNWFAGLLLVSILSLVLTFGRRDPLPSRRLAADRLSALTPANAAIITGIDPVYLEPFLLRGSGRKLIPISRRVEYASKVCAWNKLDYSPPFPRDINIFPREYLLHAGAKDAVAFTALENIEALDNAVIRGLRVFVDTSSLKSEEISTLESRYELKELEAGLVLIAGLKPRVS